MRLLNFLAGIAILIGATCSAQATVYNFTLDTADYDVVGQLTTSGNLVTSITGQITGTSAETVPFNAVITGLGNQPNIYYTSDNILESTSPFVTNEGVLFAAGGFFFNVYSVADGSGYLYYLSTNQTGDDYFEDRLFNPGSLIVGGTVAAVPELSTWIMMLVGFAGVSLVGSARGANWRARTGFGRRLEA